MRRRFLPLLLTALLALLLPASSALADDEYEIDDRLASAGFTDALSTYVNADGGVRVAVDYTTRSEDRAAYEQEAAQIARIVWEHLALRVLAVDVVPASAVGWLDGGLPPAQSFTRGDLQRELGPRPAGLDADERSVWADDSTGLAIAGVAAVVVLLLGTAVGFLLGWLVGRRRTQDPWAPPPAWSGPPPGGSAATPAAPPPATAHDPWRTG